MLLAAQKDNLLLRPVVNDIGLFIPGAALREIKQYVSENPSHGTWESYYAAFKKRMQHFGLKTEEQIEYLAKASLEKTVEGKFRLAYDPKVVFGMENDGKVEDFNLWPLWRQVDLPLLILRGAQSNVLSAETLEQMLAGKNAQAVTFEGVGHAPALMCDDQISVIEKFLSI